MTARKFSVEWVREQLEAGGGLSATDVARSMAYLSMADLRAAFFTIAEFASAFSIPKTRAKSVAEDLGLRTVRIGNQTYLSKPAIVKIVSDLLEKADGPES